MTRTMLIVGLLVAIALAPAVAMGDEVRVSSREELVTALRDAKPGTKILIASGKYHGGVSHGTLAGKKEKAIVIAAADAEKPPIFEGGGSGLHLSSPRHVELHDLVFDGANGNGLNIDDGGSADTPATGLVLKNVVVRNVGPKGNRDGIKLSGLRDFRIEGCRVERWGESGSAIDMVGCANGVVTKCTFANARGEMANGVQTKGGSSNVVISRCRFENAGGRAVNAGGSTGLEYFRPRDATFEAKDITVEDCEFIDGSSAVAFVGVDGSIVRHNTIYRPRRWAFRILQENTDERFVPSRNGKIENNVIVFRSDELREAVNIGGKTSPETFAFAGNTWSCIDRPDTTKRIVRLPAAEKGGAYGDSPKFEDAENGKLAIVGRDADDAGVRDEKQ
jgi:hypothetical protein